MLGPDQSKKQFQAFAEKYDLVYFGDVSMHDTDEPVKGMTFHANAKDIHYTHGNCSGYDVTTLLRKAKLHMPSDTTTYQFQWTVLRVKLDEINLPHILLDAHQHDEVLYKNVFAKYGHLSLLNKAVEAVNPTFAEQFYVFSTPEQNAHIQSYLTDALMQTILMQYPQFDVELSGSDLFIYMSGSATLQQLEKMLAEALWLAEHFERILAD